MLLYFIAGTTKRRLSVRMQNKYETIQTSINPFAKYLLIRRLFADDCVLCEVIF